MGEATDPRTVYDNPDAFEAVCVPGWLKWRITCQNRLGTSQEIGVENMERAQLFDPFWQAVQQCMTG